MSTSEEADTEARAAPAVCQIEDCGEDAIARGWCEMHYQRWRRTGSTDVQSRTKNQGEECSVQGCKRPARTKGLCPMHYGRKYRTGEVGPAGSKRAGTLFDRAMRKVDTTAGPNECHPWTGATGNYDLPVITTGARGTRTMLSVRRVIAEHHELLPEDADQSVWVRMRESCVPLCCNIRHMEVTTAGRPGTKGDA